MLAIFTLLTALFGIGLLSSFFYYWVLLDNETNRISLASVSKILIFSVVVSIFVAYGAGLFIVPGLLSLGSLIAVPIALIVILIRGATLVRIFRQRPLKIVTFAVYSVLLLLLQSSPALGSTMIVGACDAKNRSSAQPLIEAAERYHETTGRHPTSFKQLVPKYVSSVPETSCFLPYYLLLEYEKPTYCVTRCVDKPALAIPSLERRSSQHYVFEAQAWHWYDDFDALCVKQ